MNHKIKKDTFVLYNQFYDNQNNFTVTKINERKGKLLGRIVRENPLDISLPKYADILETESGGLIFVPINEYKIV